MTDHVNSWKRQPTRLWAEALHQPPPTSCHHWSQCGVLPCRNHSGGLQSRPGNQEAGSERASQRAGQHTGELRQGTRRTPRASRTAEGPTREPGPSGEPIGHRGNKTSAARRDGPGPSGEPASRRTSGDPAGAARSRSQPGSQGITRKDNTPSSFSAPGWQHHFEIRPRGQLESRVDRNS
jgi:hypothetical protein